jgi:hypothetical protein
MTVKPRTVIALLGGIILLMVGLCSGSICVQSWMLAAHASHYVEAELEVLEYRRPDQPPADHDDRNPIRGVLRPGDIPVWTNDDDVSVSQPVSPGSLVGRKPSKAELVGKRIPVRYWPGAENERWWFSPPAITNADLPKPKDLGTITAVAGFALVGAVWCFRYHSRRSAVEQATATTAPNRRKRKKR